MILRDISRKLGIGEEEFRSITAFKDHTNEAAGFTFKARDLTYSYTYESGQLKVQGD